MAKFNYDKDVDEKAEKGGFVLVPIGWYPMRLREATTVQTPAGNEAWKVRLEITEGDYQGQEIRDQIVFSKAAQVRSYKFIKAFGAHLGGSLNDHIHNLDTNGSQDVLVGRVAMVEIEHRQGKLKDGKEATFANPTFGGYEAMGFDPMAPKEVKVGAGASAGGGAGAKAEVLDDNLPF